MAAAFFLTTADRRHETALLTRHGMVIRVTLCKLWRGTADVTDRLDCNIGLKGGS
ncbi:MAG: hypothetical protein ABSD13_13670 [Candidatus Korobacteraceae bacterium]|jgi:hypothetical protein